MGRGEVQVGDAARLEWLDVLRVGSMFAVVFLHSAGANLTSGLGSGVWHFANLVTAFASSAVPVFFMISGALLLDSPRTRSLRYTLTRRFPRVFVPFVVWSVVAVCYLFLYSWLVRGELRPDVAFHNFVRIPAQPVLVHLWFMYVLVPLYLLSPLFKALVDGAGMKLLGYALVLWALFTSVLPLIAMYSPDGYRPLAIWGGPIPLNSFIGFAGYFLAGYYLMKVKKAIPVWLLVALVALVGGTIAAATWGATAHRGSYAVVFKLYTGPFILILSVAIFLLLKELMKNRSLGQTGAAIVGFLAPLTFCVYLCHLIFRDLVRARLFAPNSIPSLILFYLTVLAVSIAFSFVVTNIKGLSYILAGQKKSPRARPVRQLAAPTVD